MRTGPFSYRTSFARHEQRGAPVGEMEKALTEALRIIAMQRREVAAGTGS